MYYWVGVANLSIMCADNIGSSTYTHAHVHIFIDVFAAVYDNKQITHLLLLRCLNKCSPLPKKECK